MCVLIADFTLSTVGESWQLFINTWFHCLCVVSMNCLFQTQAADPEGTSIQYTLDGRFYTEDTSRFLIADDGKVWLRVAMDRDYPYGQANWQINAAADDESGASLAKRGYSIVNLKLTDINDNAPIFDTCCLIGTIPENTGEWKKNDSNIMQYSKF